MPWAPPKACRNCRGYVEVGQRYCIEHRKLEYRKRYHEQPTSAERKYSREVWRPFVSEFLAEPENRVCVDCGAPANDVYYSVRTKFIAEQPGVIQRASCAAVCENCCQRRELRQL